VKLLDSVQCITAGELQRLTEEPNFDLHPQRRIDLYLSLGPSSGKITSSSSSLAAPAQPTTADRVRTRLALLTAEKVIPLWEIACRETDANFADHQNLRRLEEERERERNYESQRRTKHIAQISVYDVPRACCPVHILELAELVFQGRFDHLEELTDQAGEWWQIYPRPEDMERECFIKGAAQEALYQALGWTKFSTDLPIDAPLDDVIGMANWHPDGPAGKALLANAGIFKREGFRFDTNKRREFWRWWLAEAIPQAWTLEHQGP
jgi:hypothetical protein